MLKFTVPPEYCLIINAFNQTNSLRGAALLLGMDAPALVRKVRKISSEFGYLEKAGNRWIVTESGRRIAQWTDEMMKSQSELSQTKSSLRISSFAWLAEEMLIPEYSRLKKLLKQKHDCSFKFTSIDQEQDLIQSRTDLVIQRYAPTDPSIAYKRIASYNWVVVTPYSWKKALRGLNKAQTIEFLNEKPFIRHLSLNPEHSFKLLPQTFADLNADGVIGIRSAVVYEEGWSVLPVMAVHRYLKEKKLFKVDLETYTKDELSVWWIRARKDLAETAKVVVEWSSQFKLES